MRYTIRPAQASDAAMLASLMRRLFMEAYADCSRPENVEHYLARAFGPPQQSVELADPDRATWIVDSPDGPCGYAQLCFPAPATDGVDLSRPAQLHRIYLAQAASGRGLGSRLLQGVRAEACRRGADGLWLSVWTCAPAPIAFYMRHGFSAVGRAVFEVGDDPLDDLILQTRFPAATRPASGDAHAAQVTPVMSLPGSSCDPGCTP